MPDDVADKLDAEFAACQWIVSAQLGDTPPWAAHGHTAWDAVWTGLTSLLHAPGLDPKKVDQVEKGQQELKRRHAAEFWLHPNECHPGRKT